MTSCLGFIRCVGCDEYVEIGAECVHCGYRDPYEPKEPDDAPEDQRGEGTNEGDHERYDPELSAV